MLGSIEKRIDRWGEPADGTPRVFIYTSSKSLIYVLASSIHTEENIIFFSRHMPWKDGKRLFKVCIHALSEFDRWVRKRSASYCPIPPQWNACFQTDYTKAAITVTRRWVPLSVCSNLITLTSVGQKKHYSCKMGLAEFWQNPSEKDNKIPWGGQQCE